MLHRLALVLALGSSACGASSKAPPLPTLDAGAGHAPVDASGADLPPSGPVDMTPVAYTTPGVWVDVSPPGIDLTATLSCGNYGALSVVVNPEHPESIYTHFDCRGVWKSTDYGMTWSGPINTGDNAAEVSDCAGGIALGQDGALYESCIRGSGTGFWKSTNDGVDWTRYEVAPGADRQDFYPPTIDPHDPTHLLMCGHENDIEVESTDGGKTWTAISIDAGMHTSGGTDAILFVDTGDAATTRKTWLFLPQGTGGLVGTWRTTDGGGSWKQVDTNEKAHSYSQLFQPDTKGVVYMAGLYSKLGNGVLRSTDYGQTWAHVATQASENIVLGTPKHVYALDSGGGAFQVGDVTGMTWTIGTAPGGPVPGTVSGSVTNDGTHHILFAADWSSGVWRYTEPTP